MSTCVFMNMLDPYKGTNYSQLPQNNGNLPLPLFGGNYPIFSWILFYNNGICTLTGSLGRYFLMIVYVLQNIKGNKNSPHYLNMMINYYNHGGNSVMTCKFPSLWTRSRALWRGWMKEPWTSWFHTSKGRR